MPSGFRREKSVAISIRRANALVQAGWDHGRRVRGLLFYVTLNRGRICIEFDGMERGNVDDL